MKGSRLWLLYPALCAAAIAGYFAVTPEGIAGQVFYDVLPIGVSAVIVYAVRRGGIKPAKGWLCLAGAMAFWAMGDISWAIYGFLGSQAPFPSVGDLFYLAGYPLLGLGARSIARERGRAPGAVADAAFVTVGLGLAIWVFLVEPALGTFSLATAVGVAYPLMNLLLIGLLTRLIYAPGARTSDRLLVMAMGLVFVADVVYGVQSLAGTYVSGSILDITWMLAYAAVGGAALSAMRPGSRAQPAGAHTVTVARLVVMSATLLVVLGVYIRAMSLPSVSTGELTLFAVVGATLVILAVARMGSLAGQAHAATEHLTASEARYRSIVHNASEGISLTDAEGRLVLANPALARMFGYPDPESMLGDLDTGAQLLADSGDLRDAPGLSTLNLGSGRRPELQLRRRDGSQFWGAVSIQPVHGLDGASGFTTMLEDVSARRETDDRMALNSLRQGAIARLSSFVLEGQTLPRILEEGARTVRDVLGIDFSGVLQLEPDRANLSYRAGAGWPRSEIDGLRVPAGRRSPAGHALLTSAPVLLGDIVQETRFELSDIARRWDVRSGLFVPIRGSDDAYGVLSAVSLHVSAFDAEDSSFMEAVAGVLGTAIERSTAQESMARAEERYRGMVENSVEGMYRTTLNGDVVEANLAMASLLGFENLDGLIAAGPVSRYYPDQSVRSSFIHRLRMDGSVTGLETQLKRRDGRLIWVRISSRLVRDAAGAPTMIDGVISDITERVLTDGEREQALVREREISTRLRAVDEMKNGFLTAVSHELRTPLTAVLGFSEILQEQGLRVGPEQSAEMIERIAANAKRLKRLLGDLLDVDRLARGVVEPSLMSTNLVDLIQAVVAGLSHELGQRIRLDLHPATILADGPKIERIVENLLTNAVRYTPAGSPILVQLRAQKDGACIAVEDRGPGVSEWLKSQIFEPFRQGDGVQEHSPGVGIGLSIVDRFARLHGGTAWVEDATPDGGARFVVTIPDALFRSPATRVDAVPYSLPA